MWLPLLHRMAAVENVYHPVVCDSCQVFLNKFFSYFNFFKKKGPFFQWFSLQMSTMY